jgi:hypothetical protein
MAVGVIRKRVLREMIQRYSMRLFVSVYYVMTCLDELLGNFLRSSLQDNPYSSLRLFMKKFRFVFKLLRLISLSVD